MAKRFFGDIGPVRYEGPDSDNPFAFRHYDPARVVMGKTMAEHLRPSVCYWHNFAWMGSDMFGAPTFERPWEGDDMKAARLKADVAFDMFSTLGFPFFAFHDKDVVPEGASLAEFGRNLTEMTDVFAGKMQSTGVKLLWGTANLFSHPRYMGGAATNPDPDVFALRRGAGEERHRRDAQARRRKLRAVGRPRGIRDPAQHRSDPRTGAARPLPLAGRRLQAQDRLQGRAAGRAEAAGAHQAPVRLRRRHRRRFPQRFGLEREVKLNIEVGHALLAHHSFEHEVALASSLGLLGSVDANRNDYQSGWDTDQFPNNAAELVPALYFILKQGGIAPGGFNFDSKVRRQSIDPGDLLLGHIGGIDACAEALVAAARLIEDGKFDALRKERYAGWDDPKARAMLEPGASPRGDRQTRRRRKDRPEAALRAAGVLREPREPVSVGERGPSLAGMGRAKARRKT